MSEQTVNVVPEEESGDDFELEGEGLEDLEELE